MKSQFNKVKKLAKQLRVESFKLDQMIDEEWGFNFSETDDDEIIDTLDYGTNSITFENFKSKMDYYKKNKEEQGRFK